MGLMDTFDSLPPNQQEIARAISDAARQELRERGVKPRNDDEAARFDEACAKFVRASHQS